MTDVPDVDRFVDDPLAGASSAVRDAVAVRADALGVDGANINHFAVDASRRQSGLGTAALKTLIANAQDANLAYLVINMGTAGRTRQVADWLTRHGFSIDEQDYQRLTAIRDFEDEQTDGGRPPFEPVGPEFHLPDDYYLPELETARGAADVKTPWLPLRVTRDDPTTNDDHLAQSGVAGLVIPQTATVVVDRLDHGIDTLTADALTRRGPPGRVVPFKAWYSHAADEWRARIPCSSEGVTAGLRRVPSGQTTEVSSVWRDVTQQDVYDAVYGLWATDLPYGTTVEVSGHRRLDTREKLTHYGRLGYLYEDLEAAELIPEVFTTEIDRYSFTQGGRR